MHTFSRTKSYQTRFGPRAWLLLVALVFCVPGIVLLATGVSFPTGIALICVAGACVVVCFVWSCFRSAQHAQAENRARMAAVSATLAEQQAQHDRIVQKMAPALQSYGFSQVAPSGNQVGAHQLANIGIYSRVPSQGFNAVPPAYNDAVKSEKLGQVHDSN